MRLTQQEKDLFIRLFFKDSTDIPKQLQSNELKYKQLKPHKQNNDVLEAQRIEKLRELCKQYSFLEAQRIEKRRETCRQSSSKYYHTHREIVLEKMKNKTDKQKEMQKQWKNNNKERVQQYQKNTLCKS